MDDVGRRFKANEIFVPEVLVSTRAMQTSMDLLEPVLAASGHKREHTVVIGTVEGDLHDIGKNLVCMMLKGANFNVIDLGTNVPPERFVEAAREHGSALIGQIGGGQTEIGGSQKSEGVSPIFHDFIRFHSWSLFKLFVRHRLT